MSCRKDNAASVLRQPQQLPDLMDKLARHQEWSEWIKSTKIAKPIALADEIASAIRGDFSAEDWPGLDLGNAQLHRVIADYANFSGSSLRGADLSLANLRFSNVRKVDFGGANLQKADFLNASMCGANLLKANLFKCNLAYADLRGVQFDINFVQCWSFVRSTFSADALPWLVLHPRWPSEGHTIILEGIDLDMRVSI